MWEVSLEVSEYVVPVDQMSSRQTDRNESLEMMTMCGLEIDSKEKTEMGIGSRH